MLMVSMLLAPVGMQLAPWCSMCLLALSLLCLPTLHAGVQSVQEAAFMVAGSKLYIQGGKNEFMKADGNKTYLPQVQLLSLDLSEDWPTKAPKWTLLAPGASVYLFVGVAATDNKTVITFKDDRDTLIWVNTYDITSNTWKPTMPLTGLPSDGRQAMRAVVDPNTGMVYINSDWYMHVFDPRENTIKKTTMIEGNIMPTRKFAGAVYLKSRQKIIYIGGLDGNLKYGPNMDISEYSPQTEGWTVWKTNGDSPSPRTDHCLATNEDGSTVVVYGGRIPKSDPADPATEFTGTLYILNVSTETWTQGPATPSRLYTVCVIIGDQFLAWGGSNGNFTIDGPPIIYSLTQKQWVDSYTAPAYMKSLPTVTGSVSVPTPSKPVSVSGPDSNDTSSPNLGAILGGVFGGLFVLTVAGTINLCLKRRADRAKYDAVSQMKDLKDKESDGSSKGMMHLQDRDLSSSSRNPQKFQESMFPAQAVRDPQVVLDDVKFRERMNGPQQHYSENSKGIKVIPQPVRTIQTNGISTAATTASDRSDASFSLSVAPTVYVNGSGFYSVPVSEVSNSTAAIMYHSDADIYNAQPVVPTSTNGISVYMTPSGQYVALAGQPIQTPGAAGYVMGYSGPAMSYSSGTSSMVAGPPSSAHTVFANMPTSTLNNTMYSSMSDSRNSLGYFAPTGSSRPKSGYSYSTGPNSTLAAASSSAHNTALTDASTYSSSGAGSMVAEPPSLVHTVSSSMPSPTVNSTVYSSMSDSRNSIGYFPPGSSRPKSGYSDSTEFNSTLVAPSYSAHNTILTDAPSSTTSSALYSSMSDSNSIGQFP